MTKSLRLEFSERLWEFQRSYDWKEQDDAFRCFVAAGDMIESVFGKRHASMAMGFLERLFTQAEPTDIQTIASNSVDHGSNWRELWLDMDGWESSCQPEFFGALHDLHAFAHYGIIPIWNLAGELQVDDPKAAILLRALDKSKDIPAYVQEICLKIDQFISLLSNSQQTSAIYHLLETRDMALARLKYDLGQPLKVSELAALSRVSLKRLQNAIYAKAEDAPVVDKQGMVHPAACGPWLDARDYFPSIWGQIVALYPLDADWGDEVIFDGLVDQSDDGEFIFVPYASDDTFFHPGLRRDGRSAKESGGFTVGAKGAEQHFATFEEALQALTKMETPRWRRPNTESGNWGIVSAQGWKRVRRVDLEGL